MRHSHLLGRALTFCLVISAVGSCRTSASPKGDQGPAIKPPLVAAEPPPDASRSKWVKENWKLHKTALTKAGLSPIQLGAWHPQHARADDPSAPWHHYGPEDGCRLFENLPGAPPRLLVNSSGQFAVSAAGTVHCVVVDYQPLGTKKEKLEGTPRNCVGGAYREGEVNYYLYVIPEGVPVGGTRTVRVPYYELDISYTEECPMVPSARY